MKTRAIAHLVLTFLLLAGLLKVCGPSDLSKARHAIQNTPQGQEADSLKQAYNAVCALYIIHIVFLITSISFIFDAYWKHLPTYVFKGCRAIAYIIPGIIGVMNMDNMLALFIVYDDLKNDKPLPSDVVNQLASMVRAWPYMLLLLCVMACSCLTWFIAFTRDEDI